MNNRPSFETNQRAHTPEENILPPSQPEAQPLVIEEPLAQKVEPVVDQEDMAPVTVNQQIEIDSNQPGPIEESKNSTIAFRQMERIVSEDPYTLKDLEKLADSVYPSE